MPADQEKGERIVGRLITAGRTIQATAFRSELARILAAENPDADTIVYVMSRVPIEARTALPFAADYLMPFLQVKVAQEQTTAADRFGIKTERIALWALVFTFVQAICAVVSIMMLLSGS